MPPAVQSLDHLVLTVADIARSCAFYQSVLGMTAVQFTPVDGPARWALKFGAQKINLHQAGQEFEPKARHLAPGSADLCFLSETPLSDWQAHLDSRVSGSRKARWPAPGPRDRSCRCICATPMAT